MRSVIVIPIAGEGSRFPREKYFVPKPMVRIDDRSIIEWTMDCIDYEGADLVFVVRREHVSEFAIDSFLKEKFGANIKIVVAEKPTDGAVSTVLLAKQYINHEAPLFIHCSDVLFTPKISAKNFDSDSEGIILTFKSNSSNYSYSRIKDGLVTEVVEKTVISDQASAGLYWFKRGVDFISAAEKMISEGRKTNNEYFIAPIYNLLIEDGKRVEPMEVESIQIFGTEKEYEFFVNNSLKSFPRNKKTVAVCSDHSGFKAKEIFKEKAKLFNLKVIDFGTYDQHDTDYNTFVKAACDSILKETCDFGFGFCRSGQGVNIAANKIKGIRSALCYNAWSSAMAVRHNCANFFALSQEHNNILSISSILHEVMTNGFDGGRHQTRLMKSES